MMKRLFLLSLLLATVFNSTLFSQSKVEIRNSFYEAESWILFEDYKEALPIYLQLLRIYPTNSNIKYRIGQCYINTPGEKDKAMTYLEDAVKNINPKYKEGKFKETGAPYDALYYLANAYRINNMLDKALETYSRFRENMNNAVYDSTVVDLQIQSCLNARELMNMPLFIKEKNLGSLVNEGNSEFNPVISADESMLVFARSEAFYDAIMYSTKVNGQWSGPMNMNEILRVDRDLFPTSISKDGKTLYLYSSADYDGIIYTSTFENNTWSPLLKLNENINTKFWESHATISHDNKKLYFTSNRKGTIGGLDIYVSKRDSTGNWGPAENLGLVINTPYNEESPFLSKDDKTLFFSSMGHFNMGGYDIFYSTLLDNGKWSIPLNVGYPLNTTDDDVFFDPVNLGYEGYLSKEINGGFGKQDLYRVEIFSKDHPRKFIVRGMVKVADLLSNYKDSVKVSAMDITNKNQTLIVYSNPETGEFEFELPQGQYKITYENHNGETIVRNVDLPLNTPADSFVLPGTILPKTDFSADMELRSSQTISVSKGDSILFPLKVEPNSVLTIEHWLGDSLLYTEQFQTNDTIFNYKMAPQTGNNKLVFKLTDKFSNTTTTEVFITREKNIPDKIIKRPEYSRVIAKKQVAALSSMLSSRTDKELASVISGAKVEKQQFGKVDDLISYLKEEAAKKNIKPEEVDKAALRVAVMDNILTQAAVDYLAKYTDGDLKAILSDLNIYDANLKTWTDLQEYIAKKTNGSITPEELNKIAGLVLSETDPAIASVREKILAYSENTSAGQIIRESVSAVDLKNIKLKGKWLSKFYEESFKRGLSVNQMADLIAAISSTSNTDAENYLNDLIAHSEEPLTSALKAINLKKEHIKTPKDLLLFLMKNKDKYPEEMVAKAIAAVVDSKNIPAENIKSNTETAKGRGNWILWFFPFAIIAVIYYLYKKLKKKDKKS